MASQDWLEKDFYKILGVSQEATDDEIKKAYRKLARKWHPDQNPGDAAAEQKFKDIGEANSVLADPAKRQEYDQLRQMVGGGARFTAGGPGGGGGAGGFEDLFGSMFGGGGGQNVRFSTGGGGEQINLDDILGHFGGGGGGYGSPYGGYQSGPRKGADLEARTSLSFRDAAAGETVSLQAADGQTIKTRIPAGVKDGQTIRLRGKGRPSANGGQPGDLLLHITVQPHPVFHRDGNNLTLDLPVTFAEAALGATVAVPTLSGKSVKVKIKPGTPSGRKLRVKGQGIQAKSGVGDLIATVQVVVPEKLSKEAKQAVETIAEQDHADGHDPRAELNAKAAQ
ncbi:molecular chaperone DnaJ [Flexivirga endophytica]|uniref:Molecular chaperone DnaJ n=1 Tax=Flexivirga endophytica TaxID=1849103 RepID=A0A916T320_9MICO|nr:DnaJ C-terminal domain-containing protein [Flexivirga endophytica]GGB29517.1 molecular chaperone DnaJ [Flexivirga endophytica]GHB50594.1 molecular chaperone DnaJ [Flexivirga endophytica]